MAMRQREGGSEEGGRGGREGGGRQNRKRKERRHRKDGVWKEEIVRKGKHMTRNKST